MGIRLGFVEKALLGACLFNGQYSPVDFVKCVTEIERTRQSGYHPLASLKDQTIYQTMVDLMEAYGGFDLTLLIDSLEKQNKLEKVDGPSYIYELTNACADPVNWSKYLDAVLEQASRREADAIGKMLQNDHQTPDFEKVVTLAQRRMDRLVTNRRGSPVREISAVVKGNRDRLAQRMENPTPVPGLRTGITRLDLKLGGLQDGWLICILANQNMGKTTACVSFSAELAKQGGGVIFPTESTVEAWTDRLAASIAGVKSDQISEGQLTDEEWTRVDAAYDFIEQQNIDIVDQGSPDIAYMQGVVRTGVEAGRYKWAVVDSYSNVSAQGFKDIYSIKEAVANGLQSMARDNKIPVLTSVQAKPEVVIRSNKIPIPEDAYGGTVITMNADVILSLYYHHHYVKKSGFDPRYPVDQQKHGVVLPDPNLPEGVALFQIAKHRHKEGVNVAVKSTLVSGSRFRDCETDYPIL